MESDFYWQWMFFKKWAIPASFSFIFDLFQTNINTIFTTNQCEKISSPSSIRSQDSNPRPLERESPPITTRPGLPPIEIICVDGLSFIMFVWCEVNIKPGCIGSNETDCWHLRTKVESTERLKHFCDLFSIYMVNVLIFFARKSRIPKNKRSKNINLFCWFLKNDLFLLLQLRRHRFSAIITFTSGPNDWVMNINLINCKDMHKVLGFNKIIRAKSSV